MIKQNQQRLIEPFLLEEKKSAKRTAVVCGTLSLLERKLAGIIEVAHTILSPTSHASFSEESEFAIFPFYW